MRIFFFRFSNILLEFAKKKIQNLLSKSVQIYLKIFKVGNKLVLCIVYYGITYLLLFFYYELFQIVKLTNRKQDDN